MPPCRTERPRRHPGKSAHDVPHGGTRPRGSPGVPVGLRTPHQPCRRPHPPGHPAAAARYRPRVSKSKFRTRPVLRFLCPEQKTPAQTSPSSPSAAGSQQNCPPSLPSQPAPAFYRTVCKSVLFPHKPKIILVLSTRISSLIITRVLCDTKSFPGRFKRNAAQIHGRSVLPLPGRKAGRGGVGVSPSGGFNGEQITGAEQDPQTGRAERQGRALKQRAGETALFRATSPLAGFAFPREQFRKQSSNPPSRAAASCPVGARPGPGPAATRPPAAPLLRPARSPARRLMPSSPGKLKIRSLFAFPPVLWFFGHSCSMWKRCFGCQSAVHEKTACSLFSSPVVFFPCFFFFLVFFFKNEKNMFEVPTSTVT